MSKFNHINTILASEFVQHLINSPAVTIAEVNALVTLLAVARVSFDLSFEPGSGREATSFQFEIHITPTSSVQLTLPVEKGQPSL